MKFITPADVLASEVARRCQAWIPHKVSAPWNAKTLADWQGSNYPKILKILAFMGIVGARNFLGNLIPASVVAFEVAKALPGSNFPKISVVSPKFLKSWHPWGVRGQIVCQILGISIPVSAFASEVAHLPRSTAYTKQDRVDHEGGVSMYICMYVCMYVCMHACMHASIHTCSIHTYIYIYTHTHTHTHIYIYMYIHRRKHTYIYIYICRMYF